MQTSQKKGREITQNPLTAKVPLDMFLRLSSVIFFSQVWFLWSFIMSALKMGSHHPPVWKDASSPDASRMCRRGTVPLSPASHHPNSSQERGADELQDPS